MQGTRLPDAVLGEPGPGWKAWEGEVCSGKVIAPAGAYMRVRSITDEAEVEYLYLVHPDGVAGTVAPPRHSWEWHEDGTVTVSPSILCTKAEHGHDWHGFLQRGVWSGA